MSEGAEFILNAAFSAHQNGALDNAKKLYEQVLKTQPNHFGALMLFSALAGQQGNSEKVVELLKKAVKINPKEFHAQFNLAVAYENLGNFHRAIEHYGNVVKLSGDAIQALINRAALFAKIKRFEEAKRDYQMVLARNPGDPIYLNALGKVIFELKDFKGAIELFKKALLQDKSSKEIFFNLANSYREVKDFKASISPYKSAIELDRGYGDAYKNLGNTYWDLREVPKAIDCFSKSMALNGDDDFYTFGSYLLAKCQICDWDNLEDEVNRYKNYALEGNKRISLPGVATSVSGSLEANKNLADLWCLEHSQVSRKNSHKFHSPQLSRKIRVGYFSPDFRLHALSSLIFELLEMHDRSKFEIFAFSLIDKEDASQMRIKSAVDYFFDISTMNDEEVCQLVSKNEIDIAIDLAGYTTGNRWELFFNRIAPIQVNYLGYPGTMGGEFMDYIVADQVLIPEASQKYYAEKIVYLPHTYQPNDTKKEVAKEQFKRSDFQLPESGLIFCCFNNSFKITPQVFASWIRILLQVNDSVLWIFPDSDEAMENLRLQAINYGLNPGRLIFAARLPKPIHLARQSLADIFLDTIPYNAHTTGSEALWMGVPVITLAGETFASRVGASLLNAIGLPELITHSLDEYEALILSIARNPKQLTKLKHHIQEKKISSPLFDIGRYTKNLERAFELMHARWVEGKKPDNLYITNAG